MTLQGCHSFWFWSDNGTIPGRKIGPKTWFYLSRRRQCWYLIINTWFKGNYRWNSTWTHWVLTQWVHVELTGSSYRYLFFKVIIEWWLNISKFHQIGYHCLYNYWYFINTWVLYWNGQWQLYQNVSIGQLIHWNNFV